MTFFDTRAEGPRLSRADVNKGSGWCNKRQALLAPTGSLSSVDTFPYATTLPITPTHCTEQRFDGGKSAVLGERLASEGSLVVTTGGILSNSDWK